MLRSKIINQEEVTLFNNEKTNTPTPWLTQIFKVNFTNMSFQKITKDSDNRQYPIF